MQRRPVPGDSPRMRAMVRAKFGGPERLSLQNVGLPAVDDDQVRIRVHSAGVNPLDWRLLRADPFFLRFEAGLFRPKDEIIGADVAGVVDAVGRDASDFSVGDDVYGECSRGAFAEYVSAKRSVVARKPRSLTMDEAAALPVAALTALQAVRDWGKLKPDQSVLVNGAGGGVGIFAVQVAKSLGARVTGVCSTPKAAMVRGLGVESVIDYTQEDFTESGPYDLILDTAVYRPIKEAMRALSASGTYVPIGGALGYIFKAMLFGRWMGKGDRKVAIGTGKPNRADLTLIAKMADEGKLRPVIDRRYPLERVPEAISYVEEGHAAGKVVINVLGDR